MRKESREDGPKVSVIVPVYNGVPFFKRCFGSILAQEFRDFEVIAVDDCSADGSADLLEKFWPKDAPPLKILRNEENMGPSVSRNRGIEAALGKYIGFLDHDDALRPGYLKTLWETAEKEQAGYVSSGARAIYGDGREAPYIQNLFTVSNREEMLRHVKGFEFNLATWGSLILRDIVMAHDIRFIPGAFEDVFFHLRVLCFSRRSVVREELLYDYYVRKESLSHDMNRKDYSYIESFCTFLPLVQEFLSTGEEWEPPLTWRQGMDIRNFFLRLMIQRLKTTALQMEPRDFEERLRERMEHYFGRDASLYLRSLIDLLQELRALDQLKEAKAQVRDLSEQVASLRTQAKVYERFAPEAMLLYRKLETVNRLLKMSGNPMEEILKQSWYRDVWHLAAEVPGSPDIQKELGHIKEQILTWMKGKEPVPRQYGALALLLTAPLSEVRPYMDPSLWPEQMKRDLVGRGIGFYE